MGDVRRPPDSKVRDIKRTLGIQTAAYICPLCKDSFSQEFRLWGHAKIAHVGQFASDILTKEGEALERPPFKAQAAELA